MPKIVAPPEIKPKTEPIITTCPKCLYTISYTEDEVGRVDNEVMGICCPQCGVVIETRRIVPFTFPDSFYHYGEDNGAICLSDAKVQEYINTIKKRLQESEVGEFFMTGSGDTMVFGFKFEDEDTIYVAKNYWEDSVCK